MVFYNRRFNPSDAGRVVAEVTALAARHNIEEIALVDSNFLVDHHRAVAIARGFAGAGTRFRWTFQASTDLLCRMSDEDVQLLGASGVSHIGFGTESASPEILRLMNKRHQAIGDIYEAARKCAKAGIRTTLNLIFGYPGEDDQHRRETLCVMGEIASRFENVTFSPNLFTPYPGIPVWPDLIARGLPEPDSLAAWAAVDLGGAALPWMEGRSLRILQRAISYFLLDNHLKKIRWRSKSRVARLLLKAIRRPLHWRLRHYSFAWPLELWLSMANRWLVMRRSLLTGQPLSHKLKPDGVILSCIAFCSPIAIISSRTASRSRRCSRIRLSRR